MHIPARHLLAPLPLALLVGCAATGDVTMGGSASSLSPTVAAAASTPTHSQAPSQAFLAKVRELCGQAFAGRVITDTPAPAANDPFAGKPLVMHVRECGPDEIRIPFHVGGDRSRTWVLTPTTHGLRLKHDHRHADGTPDATTMYGGDTAAAGTSQRQQFPVDAESQAMFTREGRTVSNTNTWAMEMHPGRSFIYELARPGRLFRVEFDLTRPVTPPTAPWGSTD